MKFVILGEKTACSCPPDGIYDLKCLCSVGISKIYFLPILAFKGAIPLFSLDPNLTYNQQTLPRFFSELHTRIRTCVHLRGHRRMCVHVHAHTHCLLKAEELNVHFCSRAPPTHISYKLETYVVGLSCTAKGES